ncbi:hypothetical protein LTR08_008399 [Meristemomyces frigidus]|nr:hypothetical protein LTR08_008399 [Meristemomyces frigidus]
MNGEVSTSRSISLAKMPNTRSLPRVLCLHGAGSSGDIYRVQGRKIFRALQTEFRFVFVDAPFPSQAGPGMEPFLESGPFFRWQCDESATEAFDVAIDEVRKERELVCRLLVSELLIDEGGPVVGIASFSQGARVATGLLHYIQQERQKGRKDLPDIRFALINSGTYPPLFLQDTTDGEQCSVLAIAGVRPLNLPTLHLIGSNDPWKPESEKLLQDHYDTSSSTVINYSGGHQVPTLEKDVKRILDAVRKVAATGNVL